VDFEVGPGQLELVDLAVAQVVGDGAGSESCKGEGKGTCKRVIAGIARNRVGNLIVRFPDAVAVETIRAKADMEARKASGQGGLTDDSTGWGVIEGVDDNGTARKELRSVPGS